jgi:hypothetical protein
MSLEQDFLTVPGQLYALISMVGPDMPQKNEKLGLKIRGCFMTREEAGAHAKRLQKEDSLIDIYVVDMYKWLLVPPDRDQIGDVHYQNEKLEEIMQGYMKNQREAAVHFEKRKKDMMAKPIEGTDTPFIEPGDENSKFYTRPDEPPVPHPAEVIEELRKEFPEADMQELVLKADTRIAAEIVKRREEREARRAAAEPVNVALPSVPEESSA